jgi:hypothetical protein
MNREIDRVIANGCRHRWEAIWWKPSDTWIIRRDFCHGFTDPTVAVAAQQIHEKKCYEAGYRRAVRCSLGCGLAYLLKTGAVVPCRDEGA